LMKERFIEGHVQGRGMRLGIVDFNELIEQHGTSAPPSIPFDGLRV
jgi:hypothetical protein